MTPKVPSLGLGVCAVVLTVVAGACAQSISGTATYRERIALPPAPVFEATLQGVSKADAPASESGGLAGSAWRLVQFLGGDDTILSPDDRSKYTIEFLAGGQLAVRIDCNRGRSSWKSVGPTQIEFGPLALTRAMCPPGSLHDRIVKDWPYVRSYVIRNGHLHLSLMADGGIYEFEPVGAGKPGAP